MHESTHGAFKNAPRQISPKKLIAGYDGLSATEIVTHAKYPDCFVSESMQGVFDEARLYDSYDHEDADNPKIHRIISKLDHRSWGGPDFRTEQETVKHRELMDGLNRCGLHIAFLGHSVDSGRSFPTYVYKLERKFVLRFDWVVTRDPIYLMGVSFIKRVFKNFASEDPKGDDYILIASGRPIWVDPYLIFDRGITTYQQVMRFQMEKQPNV